MAKARIAAPKESAAKPELEAVRQSPVIAKLEAELEKLKAELNAHWQQNSTKTRA
jgi:hypothetical protein